MSCCAEPFVSGEKDYGATDDFEIDFAAKLASNETLSAPVATVVKASNGSTSDLTLGTTGAGTLTISGQKVICRVSAGKCGTQVDTNRWETEYFIRVSATSNSGETPAGLIRIVVYDVIERA